MLYRELRLGGHSLNDYAQCGGTNYLWYTNSLFNYAHYATSNVGNARRWTL